MQFYRTFLKGVFALFDNCLLNFFLVFCQEFWPLHFFGHYPMLSNSHSTIVDPYNHWSYRANRACVCQFVRVGVRPDSYVGCLSVDSYVGSFVDTSSRVGLSRFVSELFVVI